MHLTLSLARSSIDEFLSVASKQHEKPASTKWQLLGQYFELLFFRHSLSLYVVQSLSVF